MTDSTNPFATEAAWDVSDTILSQGDHLVEILEVDGTGNSSGGHPQIELKSGNADGSIRDWIVVIPTSIGKVVQLTDAVGLDRPTDEQVTEEGTGYRLDPTYLGQLIGKKVGVIVRTEPNRNDPSKTRDVVKGYVPAGKIAKSDIANPSGDFDPTAPTTVGASQFQSALPADEDIPF